MSIVLSPARQTSNNFQIDPDDLVGGASGSASVNHSAASSVDVRGGSALSPSNSGSSPSPSPPVGGRGAMYFSTAEDNINAGPRSGDYRRVSSDNGDLPRGGSSDLLPVSDSTGGLDPSAQPQPHHMYGTFTAYCFTVNYILGVGVLGMPYAFYKGGFALSTLCLLTVSVMASLTALWCVDVSLRAQYVKRQDRQLLSGELDAEEVSQEHDSAGLVAVQPSVSSKTHHRFEMNELVEMFLGRTARRFYEVLIIIYLVGALWSYTSVFASSLASHVPLPGINSSEECDIYKDHSSACSSLYLTYTGLFALVAIPLTCLDLTEMKVMQIGLAIFRFVSLATMMATSIAAIYSYASPDADAHSPAHKPYVSEDFVAFDWSNLGFVFPVAVYSQIFHHSVPGLSHPLKDKRKAPAIFVGVLLTTMALYSALGVSVAAYYGASVPQTCTLAWADYTGSAKGPHDGGRPGWAWFISYLVVLFPPLDIISAFPLNAVTLGNNLLCAFVKDERKQSQRRYKLPFRLLAAVPPVVGAMVVKDLGVILKYTGCVGVLIAFGYPCALQWASARECARRGIVVPLDTKPLLSRFRAGSSSGSLRRMSDPSSPLAASLAGSRAVGMPSYSPAWLSDKRLVAGVALFSAVGLVAVIVLSIMGKSN